MLFGQAEASKMYRHYISSTAERDGKQLKRDIVEMQCFVNANISSHFAGYLYTINASTLGKQWDMVQNL